MELQFLNAPVFLQQNTLNLDREHQNYFACLWSTCKTTTKLNVFLKLLNEIPSSLYTTFCTKIFFWGLDLEKLRSMTERVIVKKQSQTICYPSGKMRHIIKVTKDTITLSARPELDSECIEHQHHRQTNLSPSKQ